MDKIIPIKIPLLNPNEPEALLALLAVSEGDPIEAGQVVAEIETTKTTGEVQAELGGYFIGLRFKEGDTLMAGDTLAYIGDTPDAIDPSLPPWVNAHDNLPVELETLLGLRITEPARRLALAEGMALESLPQGTLVTREMVKDLLKQSKPATPLILPTDENRLVIYGGGGHGRSLAALIRLSEGYQIVGFLDDGLPKNAEIDGLPVLGGGDDLADLAEQGIQQAVNGVGGVGDLPARLAVYDRLIKVGFYCPKVIHATAYLEEDVHLSDGVQVFPFAYIGVGVQVGYGCIINTGAIVSHDCILAAYVNLSPGATLAGGVTIGEAALIGMRATINLNVKVGKRARIGNGATVKSDVPDGGLVPAGTIWPPRR